jgi:hypothetical protein
MKGGDLIAASMRAAGLLALGEPVDGDSSSAALVILGQMLEGWSAQQLAVFTLNRSTFPFIAGTSAYTVGTGGMFNVARPAEIEYVTIISNSNPAQPLELPPLQMYTDAEWAGVPVKAVTNPDGGFPFRTLTYWPVPSDSSVQTVIGGWAALTQFTNLTSDVTFPPGYIDAIKYNFAVRLAAEWQGQVTPGVADLARTSLATIKAMNVPDIKFKIDAAMGATGGHYDWRSDTYR